MVVAAQLHQLMPLAGPKVELYVDPINKTFQEFEVNTRLRVCAWLAEIAHESNQLRCTHEMWGPTPIQLTYERNFNHPWTSTDPINKKAFELGNDAKGDGFKYRGHGLIEITGKKNHDLAGKALGLNLVATPELLEQPLYACLSAGWFWQHHGLNELADHGYFPQITRIINGGLTHEAEREAFYQHALKIIQ